MCGRYALCSTRRAIAAWFGVREDDLPIFDQDYNLGPTSFQPIVRLSPSTGEREVVRMRWGVILVWARNARVGAMRINARADDLANKPSFRDPLRKRRCLVPANAFYEWQKIGPKRKRDYVISMADGSPYAFAGLGIAGKSPKKETGSKPSRSSPPIRTSLWSPSTTACPS